MRKKVGVFGSATIAQEKPEFKEAIRVGQAIAQSKFEVICGGYGGLMEAVCQGCAKSGGRCEGIGLKHFRNQPNRFIEKFEKASSLGERLDTFVKKADRFLALPGGIGTLTEVLFVWDLAKSAQIKKTPILLYGPSWEPWIKVLRKNFIIPSRAFEDLVLITHPDHLIQALGGNK